MSDMRNQCPECEAADASRREFLRMAGGLAVASALPGSLWAGEAKKTSSESKVKRLYETLTPEQRKQICFAATDKLRDKVSANWKITEPTVDDYTLEQQDLIEGIVRGLTSEDGFERFMKQMGDDGGGLGSYHIAIFGEPDKGEDFEFVLTGRHVTMRADGNAADGVAFGGPMVYGHAAKGFNEEAGHDGNVFWYQAKRANEVFGAMDGKQREKALIDRAPAESQIVHRGGGYPGIAVGELSSDQKELVQKVMADLLSPYRKQDVDEVMNIITANGGLEKIHLAFFKNDPAGKSADLGDDGVWDVWRLEGPGFVWHFRGAPHVHTWVNIARV